jgi:hypothetical protein
VDDAAVDDPSQGGYGFTMHLQAARAAQFVMHIPEGFLSAGIVSKLVRGLQSTSDFGSKLHPALNAPKAHRGSKIPVRFVSSPERRIPSCASVSLPQVNCTG